MQGIIVATLVIGLVGLILGLALVTAGKKFYVEVDDRVTRVRECLRGANCGACGFASCDAVAEAIVAGEAHMDTCPGNSSENVAKIAAILGKESVSQEIQVAVVHCGGNCDATRPKGNYVGISDCRAAVLAGVNFKSCDYGCLGLSSCASVCPQHAISVKNGVAVVNAELCIGCGMCVKACPKHLIALQKRDGKVIVRCSNRDKGAAVKKICASGCIGCGICVKQCEQGAVTLENNLSQIDLSKCVACGKCVEKCPTKAIRFK